MKRIALVVSLALLGSLSLPAPRATAEVATWNLDPSHTTVGFAVRHMMVSNVRGTFGKVAGTVKGDPAAPATATIEATIETASVDTGNADRDEHLRGADFLDAAKFPTMTFRSKKITTAAGGKLAVTGDLTLHGVTREVVLDVEELSPPVKDPYGKVRAGARLSGKLDRKDFGLSFAKTMDNGGLLVGNEVTLSIEVEAIQAN